MCLVREAIDTERMGGGEQERKIRRKEKMIKEEKGKVS